MDEFDRLDMVRKNTKALNHLLDREKRYRLTEHEQAEKQRRINFLDATYWRLGKSAREQLSRYYSDTLRRNPPPEPTVSEHHQSELLAQTSPEDDNALSSPTVSENPSKIVVSPLLLKTEDFSPPLTHTEPPKVIVSSAVKDNQEGIAAPAPLGQTNVLAQAPRQASQENNLTQVNSQRESSESAITKDDSQPPKASGASDVVDQMLREKIFLFHKPSGDPRHEPPTASNSSARSTADGTGAGGAPDSGGQPTRPSVDSFSPEVVTFFQHILCRISGSETESQELSLGIAVSRSSKSANNDQNCIRPAENQLAQILEETGDIAHYFSKVREELVERAHLVQGGYDQLLLSIHEKQMTEASLYGLGHLSLSGTLYVEQQGPRPLSTHELYKEQTRQPDTPDLRIIWLKTTRAIRVYGEGRLILQRMMLRKSQRPIYRTPEMLWEGLNAVQSCFNKQDSLGKRTSQLGTQERPSPLFERVMITALQLSEDRHGGAIYFMTEAEFERRIRSGSHGQVQTVEYGNISRCSNRYYESSINEEILSSADKSTASSKKKRRSPPNVVDVPFTQFLNIVRQDGATILSPEGKILGSGAYFNGAGGRTETAKNICCSPASAGSKSRQGITAIIISQDGEIWWTAGDALKAWGIDGP